MEDPFIYINRDGEYCTGCATGPISDYDGLMGGYATLNEALESFKEMGIDPATVRLPKETA